MIVLRTLGGVMLPFLLRIAPLATVTLPSSSFDAYTFPVAAANITPSGSSPALNDPTILFVLPSITKTLPGFQQSYSSSGISWVALHANGFPATVIGSGTGGAFAPT